MSTVTVIFAHVLTVVSAAYICHSSRILVSDTHLCHPLLPPTVQLNVRALTLELTVEDFAVARAAVTLDADRSANEGHLLDLAQV